jgi:hypothetical protein
MSPTYLRISLPATVALVSTLAACGDDNKSTDDGTIVDTPDTAADATGSGDATGDAAGAADTVAVEPKDDGEACVTGADCISGTCLTGDEGFPSGFCTAADCESRRDCAGVGRACLRGEFNGNLCVELCSGDADCRTGYECVGLSNGAYCYPAYAGEALNPVCDSEFIAEADVQNPFFFGGGGTGRLNRHRITFEVAEGTTSFSLVAWDRRERLFPDTVTSPSGEEISIIDDYAAYYFSPLTFERVSPLLFPAGPQFVDLVEPGTWTADFGFEGGEEANVCFVVLEEDGSLEPDGEELYVDINFYFVGATGLSAEIAAEDPDFLGMLDYFRQTYAQAMIELGDVRYFDVTGDVRDQFSVIREQDAVFELVQLSRQPGETREELLSVNVFFVRGFAGEMSGVLGVSAGIPGVPGIHGSPGTGLVFASEYLGGRDGNQLVGQTLAHELGHFLGLFHTTEQQGGGGDHLEDTPFCETIDEGLGGCPDLNNLMFPVAAWDGLAEVTTGQALIVRANPLTKPISRSELR